jgi:hypothetical protein
MPEEQDKKLSYKILTAEELLKEETAPLKEVEYKEEKIEFASVQKIESQKRESEEAQIREPESVKEIELEPTAQKIEAEITPSEKILPSETEVSKEVPSEEFVSKAETEAIATKEEVEEKTTPKHTFSIPASFSRYVLYVGGLLLIFVLFLFFKPHEKLGSFLEKKKEEKKEPPKGTTTAPVKILFPTATKSTSTIEPLPKIVTPTISIPSPKVATLELPTTTPPEQKEFISQPISLFSDFSSKEIIIDKLDTDSFRKALETFISYQEKQGTKVNLEITYNNKRIPPNLLFEYWIKPKGVSLEKIKDNLTGYYNFLLYYSYTRKYPVLVFEIKNKEKVVKFNQEWERSSMREDLNILFFGLKPPEKKVSFTTKKIGRFTYRILDLGDNFKIIWAVANDYLIYSTTETGIKEIFNILQ